VTLARTRDRRWLALAALCTGMLMIILDQTIVNVALPAIQADLGFTQSGLAWVVNAYLIAFGGLLLLAGRLGDLVGRKRVLVAGLVVFTAGSLLCGVSNSQGMLIVMRFVQGVGGAMASSLILGMIVAMFPDPRERARAIGAFSFVAAAGGAIGLLAGGLLTQAISWHWIFFVNLPIGLAATALVVRLVEPDRGIGLGEGADAAGAALVTAALMLGVYTVVGLGDAGRGPAQSAALGAVALALLAAFVVRQATAPKPLLPLGLFRSRNTSGANLVQTLMVGGIFGFFFLGTLYLQRVLGYDPLRIGLAFLPVALAIGGLSIDAAARLNTRFGARPVLLVGLSALLAGLLWFGRAPLEARYVADLLPVMLLAGVGGGLSFPALMTLAMADAAPSDAGLASGLVSTTAQAGGALGLAVLATLATARTERLLAEGVSSAAALAGGYQLAFAASAGLVAAALVLAAVALRPAARACGRPVVADGAAAVAEGAAGADPLCSEAA
jgi:EmrB/QacA subfamily drug resistance transporter